MILHGCINDNLIMLRAQILRPAPILVEEIKLALVFQKTVYASMNQYMIGTLLLWGIQGIFSKKMVPFV